MGNTRADHWISGKLRVASKGKNQFSILFISGILLGVFVIFPLALLILNSFREVGLGELGLSFRNLTLGNYITAYSESRTWKMLWDTFIFAAGTMVVAFVVGGVMAFLVERTDAPWRRVSYGMMFIPLIIPGMLLSISWIFLLSPNIGIINKLWMSMGFTDPILSAYSMPMMWWVQGIIESPLTFLLLGSALRRMDPALEEAATTAGATRFKSLTRVTLKLMAPTLAGVALLQFVRALEAMDTPLIIGLNAGIKVFSTNILLALNNQFPPDYGLGFAYSMTLIVLTAVGLFVYSSIMRQSDKYAVITGKGYRPQIIHLGRWKVLAACFQALFAIVAVALPLAVLVWMSLLPNFAIPSREALADISLQNYASVVFRPDMALALKNTVIVGICVAFGVMVVSLLLSWVVFHMKIRGGKILDGLAFMPYAIPSIAMAVAFLALFLSFKNPIYNTVWILVIAYIVRFLPYGTRFTNAGLVQIKKEMEEAAVTSGAKFRKIFVHIIGPLMKPILIGGGLYVLVLSIKTFPMAVILSSPQNIILSVKVWWMWSDGKFGEVSALAVMIILALSIITFLGGTDKLSQQK
ncbi:MAG: iron ABC transporter permease [Chloroflexi bacterium]|nr:iron ABC transporter permease [Chloroflexota bacterium]